MQQKCWEANGDGKDKGMFMEEKRMTWQVFFSYSPCLGRVSRARSAREGMRNSSRRCLSGSWLVRYSAYSRLSWGRECAAAAAWLPPMMEFDSAILYADAGE